VVWGHEHDCRIVPEKIPKKQFYVCQPGSSVATSLAEGESYDKHCGLLMIHRKVFKLEPIKLKTVRPFIFRSINLADHVEDLQLDEGDVQEKTIKFAEQQIDEMIAEAASKLCGYENQPTLPLIRLRLECTDNDQSFNTVRFSQQYLEKVKYTNHVKTTYISIFGYLQKGGQSR
jgi:double-strand break repair protein MRE11